MSINYWNDQSLSQAPARIEDGKLPIFFTSFIITGPATFTYETVAAFGQNVPCSGFLKNLGGTIPGLELVFKFAFDEGLNYTPLSSLLDDQEIDLSVLPPIYGIYISAIIAPTKFSLLLA